jgi:hypothetical protein
MPRDPTSELAYVPLNANPAALTNVSAAVAGWAAVGYEVEQPQDPILVEIYIPQLTIVTLNAILTLTLVDQTVAGQFVTLQTAIAEGITAAGNTGPVIVKARFQPQNFPALSTPGLQGPRLLALNGITSAGNAQIVASAAITAYFQVLDLARQ